MIAGVVGHIATLRLHLGFSAKLTIWQVPTCKMEPRSGNIMQLEPPTKIEAKVSDLEIILSLLGTGHCQPKTY